MTPCFACFKYFHIQFDVLDWYPNGARSKLLGLLILKLLCSLCRIEENTLNNFLGLPTNIS